MALSKPISGRVPVMTQIKIDEKINFRKEGQYLLNLIVWNSLYFKNL
jgi:hypothetical protein